MTFEKVKPYDAAIAKAARETLRERRKTEGGVEDLLERMREIVYQPRGDGPGVDEDGNAKPRRKRGTGPSGGKFTPTPSKPEAAAALRAAGGGGGGGGSGGGSGGGEVGAMHRAHSAVGVKMDKAKRPEFRGKNT